MHTHLVQETTSYWHITAAPSLTPTADLPAATAVAVVGGGLLGAAISYWLARAGVAVVLLESATLAAGATGRNGGFVVAGTAEPYPAAIARLGRQTARDVWALTVENRRVLRETLAEEAINCDYREPGHLSLTLSEGQLADMASAVAARQADGFAADLLDRRQVQEHIGAPLGSEIAGGVFVREDGLVHSARLVQGLAGAAQRHGASIHESTPVVALEAGANGVVLRTTRGELRANAVVVAVNAWTDRLVPELSAYLTPVRGQVLAYTPIAPAFSASMSAAITSTGEYWQQAPDGTIVLGGCRAVAPGSDSGVRTVQTTAEVQAALESILPRLIPSLDGLRVAHRWAGLMAFTPDYLPIADRAPGLPGVWVVGGFCGHGMPFGMRLGQLLAHAAIHDVAPAELSPFRLSRPTLNYTCKM